MRSAKQRGQEDQGSKVKKNQGTGITGTKMDYGTKINHL